jgi:RNA polymerase sigma-70 factor (ECF subfamily)
MSATNEDFIKLFMPLQGDLLAFVMSMGVRPSDADDVLQEAACVILRKISEFQTGTNFRAWAYAIVRNEVSTYLKMQKRRMLRLTNETAAELHRIASDPAESTVLPLAVLRSCVERLQSNGRNLIRLRYEQSHTVKQIADEIGRPVESVYVTLSRLRKVLSDCVQRQQQLERGSA